MSDFEEEFEAWCAGDQPFTVDFEPERERPPVGEFDRPMISPERLAQLRSEQTGAWPANSAECFALVERIYELEHDFAEAVDLAEEAIPYAGEYFIEKWDLDGRCERLKAKIDPESAAYKEFWR